MDTKLKPVLIRRVLIFFGAVWMFSILISFAVRQLGADTPSYGVWNMALQRQNIASVPDTVPIIQKSSAKVNANHATAAQWNSDTPPIFNNIPQKIFYDYNIDKQCFTELSSYAQIYRDLAPFFLDNNGFSEIEHSMHSAHGWFGPTNDENNPDNAQEAVFTETQDSVFGPLRELFAPLLPSTFEYALNNRFDEPQIIPADNSSEPYATPNDIFPNSKCMRQKHDTPSPANTLEETTNRYSHGFFMGPDTFIAKNSKMPLFSQCKTDCFWDIVIPMNSHPQLVQDGMFADPISWADKKDVLFWRGSTTSGKFIKGNPWRKFHRTRLVQWAEEFEQRYPENVFDAGRSELPKLVSRLDADVASLSWLAVDVGFHATVQVHGEVGPTIEEEYPFHSYVSFKDCLNFKYLLVVDGNTWPSRTPRYLTSNSVILLSSAFTDWYMWMLKPFVHYIPVALDLSDLEERLRWLKDNDEKAHQISINANMLMERVNRLEQMQCYAGLTMLEYNRIYQNFVNVVSMTATTLTDNSKGSGFGKNLAHSDKDVRDKALAALTAWLSTVDDLSSQTMLKLWKGLYYCYWMSDKTVVQHELAETLSGIALSLPVEKAMLYFEGFWKIIVIEWAGIDRLRLDKFFNLLRNFHCRGFKFLENNKWERNLVEKYTLILKNGPLHPTDLKVAHALRYHSCDVYLEELNKGIEKPIPVEASLLILSPFFEAVAKTSDKSFLEKIGEVFGRIVDTIQNNVRWEDEPEKKEWSIALENTRIVRMLYKMIQTHPDEGVGSQLTGQNKRTVRKICQNFFEFGNIKESDVQKDLPPIKPVNDKLQSPVSTSKESPRKGKKKRLAEEEQMAEQNERDEKIQMKNKESNKSNSPSPNGKKIKLSEIANSIAVLKPKSVAIATRLNTEMNSKPIKVKAKDVEEHALQHRGKFADPGPWKLPRSQPVNLSAPLGIGHLPAQRIRRSKRDSGLGKTAFLNSLFNAPLAENLHATKRSFLETKTVNIQPTTYELIEDGVVLHLTVIETPGFGDQLNRESDFSPVLDYADQQFAKYHKYERSDEMRKKIQDTRIHALLYLFRQQG
ncbi:hypothetical protein HK100_002625, partial [Physocladia obscura]